MEIKSVIEQEILNCFRQIEQGKTQARIDIDEDLTVTAKYSKINGIVTIEIYGCAVNEG
jgi:hypothetical protein